MFPNLSQSQPKECRQHKTSGTISVSYFLCIYGLIMNTINIYSCYVFINSFLLGLHNVALEAYLEAQQVSKTPDWDIFHNLGNVVL